MLLKVSGIWTLVSLELELGPGVWLAISVFAMQPSILANCSLVLLLQWGFDCKWVEELGLLVAKLVTGLVGRVSSYLGLLSTVMILGPGTGKTVWASWIVWVRDLEDDLLLWQIYLECYRVFGKSASVRLLLKHEIVLKGVPSSGTRVDSKWVKELWWKNVRYSSYQRWKSAKWTQRCAVLQLKDLRIGQ